MVLQKFLWIAGLVEYFRKCDDLVDKTLQALLENHLTESGSHVVNIVNNHCLDTKDNRIVEG